MAPRFYNTLTQHTETLEPLVAGEVRIYVCGLTTYDLAHAGHARTNTTFDVLTRHLRARGYRVTYCRNVTDVDDKIVKRAKEVGEEPLQLSKRMSELADKDLAAIGCARPDHEPRVSTHIPEICALIEKLIEGGHAYVANTPKGRDVYFGVRSFQSYGKLSRRNIDDLLAGARVEVGDVKKDPLDFALWKGEPEGGFGWPSPWGLGRPGWHIECSAMARKYLGSHFDIHCGGMDLIFPHHENEIAQSEAVDGPPFAKVWLHGGFLNVDSEKMSKSLGNFVTIRDVLERNDAEGFRYYLLGTHYRGPLSFDLEKRPDGRVVFLGVDEAERRVDYLYGTAEALRVAAADAEPNLDGSPAAKIVEEAPEKVLAALDNDLNTPVALSVLAELTKVGNDIATSVARLKKDPVAQGKARSLARAALRALEQACVPLGLMQASAEDYLSRTRTKRLALRNLDAATIDKKVRERTEAREAKDFEKGDALRKELQELGIELLDAAGTTSWRVIV